MVKENRFTQQQDIANDQLSGPKTNACLNSTGGLTENNKALARTDSSSLQIDATNVLEVEATEIEQRAS
jgi:hypothetical protein